MKANRFLLFILACILSIGTGWGKSQTFYYKYTAKTSTGNTTYGSVYANTTGTEPKSKDFTDKIESKSIAVDGYTAQSITLHLWAKPADGYTLEKWSDGTNTIAPGIEKNGVFSTSVELKATGTSESKPSSYTYTATFTKLGVVHVLAGEGGAAYIDKINNKKDDVVKLTAHNLYDYNFKGWEHNESIVSTDKEYTLTVSNATAGDYTAIFEKKTVTYYRLRNQNGYYLSIVGNQGYEIQHEDDGETFFDGFNLNGTIKLTKTNVITDPSTILKISHKAFNSGVYTEFNMEAQGINLKDVIKADIEKVKQQSSKFDMTEEFVLTWDGKDGYRIKNRDEGFFIQSVGSNSNAYFVSDAYPNANEDVWYFEPVDEEHIDSYYFGVVPERHAANGKHYTTLYTSFPYQCADDMKAYYADNVTDDGVANCYEITSGKVPALTPVILECTSTSASNNRLVPLSSDEVADDLEGTNLMKGVINLYTSMNGNTPVLSTTAFDASDNNKTMRVFDLDSKDDPIFNKNNTNTPSTYLASNTGYLDYFYDGEILLIQLWNPSLDIYVDGELDEEGATAEDFIAAQKENPNIMAVVLEDFADSFQNIDNVIVQHGYGSTATYDCANFVLTDKINWGSPVSFTAKSGSYERSNVGGLNSVCMPFAISTSDLPEGSTIYSLVTIDMEKSIASFEAVNSVAAGTPCLIKCADDAELWDFLLSNASVSPEVASVVMKGSYTKETLGLGYLKVNSDGTALTKTTASSTITPFRSYLVEPANMPAKALTIQFHTPTGIMNLDNITTGNDNFYSVDGRQSKALRKGINIVRNTDGSTRKILK